MLAPAYQVSDFLAARASLCPTGPIWPRDPASVQSQVLALLSPTYIRSSQSAAGLLVDAFPATSTDLLPEWELTCGLPDPCAGTAPSIDARRQQVVARIAGRGGQSVGYIVGYAANLGYTITVTEFSPFFFNGRFGSPMNQIAFAFTWKVNAPAETVRPFLFGDQFGEAFRYWGNSVLECELNSIKPAHTVLVFSYTQGS